MVEPSFSLRVQKSKLIKFGGRLMKVIGPQVWNLLPNDIQESISEPIFKKGVKTFYISQYLC